MPSRGTRSDTGKCTAKNPINLGIYTALRLFKMEEASDNT